MISVKFEVCLIVINRVGLLVRQLDLKIASN